jgi:hypothetical protein
METFTEDGTFQALNDYLKVRFDAVENIIKNVHLTKTNDGSQSPKVYLGIYKVQDAHARKPKTKLLQNMDIQERRKRRQNQFQSSAPIAPGEDDEETPGSHLGNPQGGLRHDLLQMGGYIWAIHYPSTGNITIVDIILRVPGIRRGDMEKTLLKALIGRIHADTNNAGPTEVTNATVKSNPQVKQFKMVLESVFPKWRNQFCRMGFSETDPNSLLAASSAEERAVLMEMMGTRKDGGAMTMTASDLL